jgi:hypothetical protein
METIDEMIDVVMGRRKVRPGIFNEQTEEVAEFLESLREHVIFCQKCKKLRLDPGLEMTMTVTTESGEKKPKKLEMCEPCLEEFLGKMAPHASEAEFELEGGTRISTLGGIGSGLMTVHDPDDVD